MQRREREAVGLRLAKAGAHRGEWGVLLGVALAMVMSLFGSAGSSAQKWERTIQQYQHTTWTAREGVPTVVYCMAQTADGYLWLGSLNGLFRLTACNSCNTSRRRVKVCRPIKLRRSWRRRVEGFG
jgi:hypothetical protein